MQRAFAEHGLPAPRPLSGPVPYGPVHITAETMLTAGRVPTLTTPRYAARSPADSLASSGSVEHSGSTPPPRSVTPWPCRATRSTRRPHSARFDFEATAAGAEWIDAYARRARAALASGDCGPEVLVHGDWRIENVNVAAGEVVAIYDWDSVCIEPELFSVATSAITFCVDWLRPVGEHFPTNAEIGAFIGEYEAARGAPFSDPHRDLLAARMVYGLSYGARCEHADNFPEVADSQQGLLRRLGDPLLTDGLAALRPE